MLKSKCWCLFLCLRGSFRGVGVEVEEAVENLSAVLRIRKADGLAQDLPTPREATFSQAVECISRFENNSSCCCCFTLILLAGLCPSCRLLTGNVSFLSSRNI